MDNQIILLVEDNPDDELLTIRALKKNHIINKVVIARDGTEALDYLYGRGAYAERDIREMPQVILLDLKLPKIDGMEVLKHLRSDESTKELPVIVFISSKDEKDLIESYNLGPNGYIHKPLDYDQFNKAINQIGLYWLVLNKNAFSDKDQKKAEKSAQITPSDDKPYLESISNISHKNNILGKNAIHARLSELIFNMSEEEIGKLIEDLEESQQDKFMEKRKYPRKRAFLFAECSSHNCSFSDFIQNISSGGLYIETRIPLFIDQKLSITFSPPNTEDTIKIRANVVRSDSMGFAVKFDEILQHI